MQTCGPYPVAFWPTDVARYPVHVHHCRQIHFTPGTGDLETVILVPSVFKSQINTGICPQLHTTLFFIISLVLCKAVVSIVLLFLFISRGFGITYIICMCSLHYTTAHLWLLYSLHLLWYC